MKNFTYYVAAVLILLIIVFIPIVVLNILSWYRWYKLKPVIFVVDIDRHFIDEQLINVIPGLVATDISNLCNMKNFSKCKQKIVVKIYDGRYDVVKLRECIANFKDRIFSVIYIDENMKKMIYPEFCETYLPVLKLGPNMKKISKDDVEDIIKDYGLVILNFENTRDRFRFKHQVLSLRSFLLDLNLIKSLGDKVYLNTTVVKLKKAVFERSCSVIYILPSEYLDFENNLKLIMEIVNKAKIRIKMETLSDFKSRGSKIILNLTTILLAVLTPIFLYKFALEMILVNHTYVVFFVVNFLIIFLGMFLWGLNQRYEYISLQNSIYGIKLMFILPILIIPFIVFNQNECNGILNSYVRLKDMLLFLITFTVLIYIILRTENINKRFLLPFELQFREFVETYMLFRPRFKELITQPLLFVSLNMFKKGKDFFLTKFIFCISIISMTSIINTFLHTHTPLWLCVLRSLCSMIIGLLFGIILTNYVDKIYNKQTRIV